ncbi:hypothetical protein CCACVL1_17615 [Corchorus capsularis]|uniref:Integrase catalytic domain-containing protein n=1 Tax=Corchorus capsularis TaxID=210143 RepID=A0A1R3HQR7_COCAP|nr:hypothetical protein CCACVL1_17615 [Corchorus capsularis]
MKEDESVKQYADRIVALINQIKILGEQDYTNNRILDKILNTLPEKYEAKISALEVQQDVTQLSLQELINSLYSLEQRRATRQQAATEGEFSTKGKEKVQTRGNKKGGWKKKNNKEATTSNNDGEKKKTGLYLDEEQLFVAQCSAVISKSNKKWLIDSGATNHMVHDKKLFSYLDETYTSKVKIGDGKYLDVKGKGNVQVCTPSGTKIILDVVYVPLINQNLVSVSQLVDDDYAIVFKGRTCTIYEPAGNKLISVGMKHRCFSLAWNDPSAYTSSVDDLNLWHQRLGHVNNQSLSNLQKNELVVNLPKFDVDEFICEACRLGKLCRAPFPAKSAWRASMKLQLVHTDICGPVRTSSLNGRYFILFIDDFNRFEEFLAEAGIVHQLTVTFSPQQNAVSERKNRTAMDMARCLLFEKKLPKKFWAEAVNTAVYLLNRLPTKALKNLTPYEGWSGAKPSVTHLKVFGCVCYTWIPNVKRGKLDEKAQIGVFVGYSIEVKGYRIYNPTTNKVYLSRDVKFDENAVLSRMKINGSFLRGTKSLEDVYKRCNIVVLEPSSFEEAMKLPGWMDVMKEELTMIEKNKTWQLVNNLENKKPIGVKWVYKTKLNSDGSINKLKTTLVVKGYAQHFAVDFNETFAPVARLDTIRLLLALAAQNKWKVYQLDVKSAFLNGFLQEEIYVEQPDDFKVKGNEYKVYLLKKALYGLKQAPRAWYDRINAHLLQCGFQRSPSEPTLYIRSVEADLLIVSLYVDDLLVLGSNQDMHGIFIGQQKYTKEILKKFKMDNCKAVGTPLSQGEKLQKEDGSNKVDETLYRSLVGCLLYLTDTRLDILYAVSLMSKFMHSPSELHFRAAKRVLSVFCWCSKKQNTVAQSTTEAEYVAVTVTVNQAIWLKKLLIDLKNAPGGAIKIMVDNQSAIAIAKNLVSHGKTKHFMIKFHFVREMQQAGEVSLNYCTSEEQLADFLTKALPRNREWKSDDLENLFSDEDCFYIRCLPLPIRPTQDGLIWNEDHLIRFTVAKAVAANSTGHLMSSVPIARWSPPAVGSWKINTDAAFDKDLGVAGLGAVLRDFEGRVLCSIIKKMHFIQDPLFAVLYAIQLGLQLARSEGFLTCVIESDCLLAITAINTDSSRFWEGDCLVSSIRDLAREFSLVLFHHIKREVNCCAHAVAKFAMQSSATYVRYGALPSML